jgi:hypothetical protein
MTRLTSESEFPATRSPSPTSKAGSWVLFAGIMICLVGVLNVIWGIAAIADSRFFIGDARFILSGLSTWGWIILIIGVAEILAAYSIWSGADFGRWAGIGIALLNSIAALMSLPAYPFWSLAVFTLGILVIYGLATYGGDPRVVECRRPADAASRHGPQLSASRSERA